MDNRTIMRITSDPNYRALVSERTSFGWTLAIVMLALYYGYVAIVAFAPGLIAAKVAGSITVGILMGAFLILISIVLTGVYVARANTRYDALTQAIVKAVAAGGSK